MAARAGSLEADEMNGECCDEIELAQIERTVYSFVIATDCNGLPGGPAGWATCVRNVIDARESAEN